MSSINSVLVLRCIHRLFGISRLVFAKVCRFTQMIRRICRLTMPANENKRLAVESHCVCCDEGMISYFSKRFKIKGLCNERYKIKAQIDYPKKKLIIFLILDESVSHSRHQRNTLTLPAEQKLNIILLIRYCYNFRGPLLASSVLCFSLCECVYVLCLSYFFGK